MVLWFYGSMVLWLYGSMALWLYGSVVLWFGKIGSASPYEESGLSSSLESRL